MNTESSANAAPATRVSPMTRPLTKEENDSIKNKENRNGNALFPRANLLMMAGCLILIILGFILMTGGSSSVEGGFNPDIFSTRRIVVGPTVAFLGFLLMAFAIIWNPRKKKH